MQVTRRLFFGYIKPTTLVAADVLSEVEGLDKTFKFARSIVELQTALSLHASESLEILGTALKNCSEVMLPFQFFKIIKLWFDVKNKSWAGIASLTNATALTTIGITKFLAKLKLFDLAALTQKIGAIPVLGTLIQIPLGVFIIGANGFSLIDTKMQLNKNASKLQSQRQKLHLWGNRCHQWSLQPIHSPEADLKLQEENLNNQLHAVWTNPEAELTARQQSKLNLLIDSCATVAKRIHTEQTPVTLPNAAKAYLEVKHLKWQNRISNLKIERTKFRFSILVNISLIATSILGIAATSLGITAFAATTVPMLVLGLFVASIAFSKIVYDKVHKSPKEAPSLKELQDEIVKEYKHNKRHTYTWN
jgi:hypothetical protein